MQIHKKVSLNYREKIVRWRGITLYHRRSDWKGSFKKFLGIPIVRKVRAVDGVRRYVLGIYVDTEEYKGYRRTPPILPVEEYVRLKHSEPKEMLITPLVGIGDYIVMRNLIAEIKKTEKYKDYRITLICDTNYAFAKCLDYDVVDKILPMKMSMPPTVKDDWRIAEASRQALIKEGLKSYYDTVLFIGHVLDGDKKLKMTQHLVHHVVSRERIEFEYERRKVNALFFQPCTRMGMGYFSKQAKSVFSIWKGYFEEFLERPVELPYPVIEPKKIPTRTIKEGRYMVVSPCSSASKPGNMWNANNWAEVLQWLWKKEKMPIIITVANSEVLYAERLKDELVFEGVSAEVMAGLEVKDLLALLNRAELYMGLDSGLFHIAAAMGKKGVCISSGVGFARWLQDYEIRSEQLRIVLPPNWRSRYMDEMTAEMRDAFSSESFPINAVRVEDVAAAAHDLLYVKKRSCCSLETNALHSELSNLERNKAIPQ